MEDAAAAQKLLDFLRQIAHKAANNCSSHNNTAADKQYSIQHSLSDAIRSAENNIEVLMQVPWFRDLATWCCHCANITPDGHITLGSSSSSGAGREQQHCSSNSSTQQQQRLTTDTQLSMYIATTIAKLAVNTHSSSSSTAQPVEVLLLQQLLPQLLSCPAACDHSSLKHHWTAVLVTAAVQLYCSGSTAAAELPCLCLQHLQAMVGSTADTAAAAAAAPVRARSQLQLGDAVGLTLLAAITNKQQQQQQLCSLSDGVLHQLLDCTLAGIASTGGDLQQQLQSVLLPPLMAAAAAQLPTADYEAACQQVVLHACNNSSSSSNGVAAAAGAGSSSSSNKVAAGLMLACRLQDHVMVACKRQGSAAAVQFHELLLQGLLSRDIQYRNRARHLLQATLTHGCQPQVSGFTEVQWQAFLSVFKAQEERVLHLVEPVWTDNFPLLWTQVNAAASSSGPDSSSSSEDYAAIVRWCSVLLLRAAFHTNVSVRRLGLAALFNLPCNMLQHVITHGGWRQLQDLLLQLLAAFENEKLVSEIAAGSATSRQAQAVAALQQQLTEFVTKCLTVLLQQQQAAQQQQQQRLVVAGFVTTYLDKVVEVSERAPTAGVLLHALAAAAAAAVAAAGGSGSSSSSGVLLCDLTAQQLLQHIGGVLGHINYLHPAYLRNQIQRSILQLMPLCCDAQSCGAEAALSIVAASGAAAAALVQAEGALQWLDAALLTPPPAAAAAPDELHATQLSSWLQPVWRSLRTDESDSSGGTVVLPQHKLLYCLGELTADLSPSCQIITGKTLDKAANAAAAAVAAGNACSAAFAAATALACLACGVAASYCSKHVRHTVNAAAAAESAVQHGMQSAIVVLLRFHATLYTPNQLYDLTWLQWLTLLLQTVLQNVPHQRGDKNIVKTAQQLWQHAVLVNLYKDWLPRLCDDIIAAAAASDLDHQLLNLGQSYIASLWFQTDLTARQNAVADAATATASSVITVQGLDHCLDLLCQLQPAETLSPAWHAEIYCHDSISGSSSRMELTESLLELRIKLVAALVAAAAVGDEQLAVTTRRQIFTRCLEDLEWSSNDSNTLLPLLQTLIAVAPFETLQQQQQQEDASLQQQQQSEDAWSAAAAVTDMQQLLQQFQPIVRGSKRLSEPVTQQLVQLFFHPDLFQQCDLQAYLTHQLIPFALAHGGVRLSVTLMAHLCTTILNPNKCTSTALNPSSSSSSSSSSVLEAYLPHIAHMCAFSLFTETVSQQSALHHQKFGAAVVLPARVVLAAQLQQIARSGLDAPFLRRLVLRLLDIVQGCGPYAWLSGRESGQASGANAIKVAAWQTLCLLAPYVDENMAAEVLDRGWCCLLSCHHHGNIRPYVQLFLLALLHSRPGAVQQYLIPALNTFETSSYQVTVSVMILVLFLLLECGPNSSPHFMPLLRGVLPWALHHRHAVRVPVQAVLHVVFRRHMAPIEEQLGQAATDILHQVDRFLTENDEVAKLRQRQALVDLDGFSLQHETSLEGIFGVQEAQLEQLCDADSDTAGVTWHIHIRDRLPMDLLKTLPGAVKAVGRRDGSSSSHKRQQTADEVNDADSDDAAAAAHDEVVAQAEQQGIRQATAAASAAPAGGGAAMYQFRPQVETALFDESSSDRAEALLAARAAKAGLVVCASLLDNVPNLAGLCRTCESMSVEALVLSNRSVAFTDAFKRQSVTSERWLQLLEVGVPDVATFLQERKAAGYTIIGVEQATNSVPLQSYSFPQQCVLLLGNEQNGIPVTLLPLLDVCVEIPMLGVTRSLNAHVSGAMVVWQYTQQHLPQSQ